MLTNLLSVFVLPIEFTCTILNDNSLLSNNYYIKLGINPTETSDENLGIGFQRIQHIADELLFNGIILNKESSAIGEFSKLENNLICLPCDPYDIYVGSILFSKFQAITEEYFDIQYLSIASTIGNLVQYNIIDPDDSNLELEGDHWWNQNNVYTGSKGPITWEELNLTEVPKFKPTVIKGGLSENK